MRTEKPFRLDCKKAYAAQSVKAKNPAIAAKQMTRTTGPTSGPTAATERQEHPRRPPRVTRR
jgi:hypothetical protein